MEMSVTLPLDDGFMRRQCPNCNREFKWHHGPTEDRPGDAVDPPIYYCPYCGEPAGPDSWWTAAQLEHAQAMVTGPALREITDELESLAKRHSGGLVKLSVRSDPQPEPPAPLTEPNDMTAVTSPCHPWEPIKIDEEWHDPLHCLVCGERFAI